MNDYTFVELWPIAEIADHLPRLPGGSQHATSKIYRWLNLSGDTTRRTLRSELIGRYRYCCDRWLADFFRAPSTGTPPRPTPGQRDRHRQKIKQQLTEAGI